MTAHRDEFEYESRRSREEAVMAIEAETPAVAWAHRRLSVLHAARAMQIARARYLPPGEPVAAPQG